MPRADREAIRRYQRSYYHDVTLPKRRKLRKLAQVRRWRLAHPERVRANRRRWKQEHREQALAQKRAWARRYRQRQHQQHDA